MFELPFYLIKLKKSGIKRIQHIAIMIISRLHNYIVIVKSIVK